MMATFPASAMARLPVIGAMLAALLAGLAIDDGCIELMGAIPGACGFLQGWGGPVPQDAQAADGGVEALLVGERILRCRVRVATFARPDIVTPASGMVLVVADPSGSAAGAGGAEAANTPALAALPGLDQVYLLTEGAVLRRVLVERRLLSPGDSAGHIRDMLPALSCPPAAADCLRLALRPRYEGRETLGEQALPVRAAVDQALFVPAEAGLPGGVYLGGWLYDPQLAVAEVTVRDLRGFTARLDRGWTRIPRTDVTAALTASGFPAPQDDAHGFAVFVEGPGTPGDPLYLDISFRNGTCAFLPVIARPAADPVARARILDGTDLHKPSGISVVERQLGPLSLALMRRAPARPPVLAALPAAGAISVALVLTLVGKPLQPRSVLSQFLHDPLGADEALLLVCGAAWDDGAVATLRRTAAFMGLAAQVVRAADAADATAALDAAAEAVAAQRYLLLDPGTAGCRSGWRRHLRAAAEAAQAPAVVCPTLVYEDLSLRYAGAEGMLTQPVAPYVTIARAMAGMPAALADDGPPRATALGTLACCLVPRAALLALGGARTRLATAFGQETAFFLRLRAAGIACLWAPRARVYAPDAGVDMNPGTGGATTGGLVGRLVDGWCLRAAQESGLFAVRTANSHKRAEG
jgi:hypothetical protein